MRFGRQSLLYLTKVTILFRGTMKLRRVLFGFCLAFLTTLLIICSSTAVNARPCGDDFFSKIGCALDPTNPSDNGGVIFTREQIDKAKDRLRATGRYIDRNITQPVVRPIVKATDWLSKPAELYGESGRAAFYAAKIKIASDNITVPKEPIPGMFKSALRQKYGDLVDQVEISYGANLLNTMCIFQNHICIDLGNTLAQTFGDTIYIKASKPAPEHTDYEPPIIDGRYSMTDALHWNRFFLALVAHELKHVQQYRDAGSTGRFGYEYFKSYKESGHNYWKINKEVEAIEYAEEFLSYGCSVAKNFCMKV
jgi:hypothetical protein